MEETADKLNHYSGVSIIPDDVEQDDPSLVLILRGVDPNGEGNEGGMMNNSGGNGGGGGGGGGGDGGGGGRRKYLVSMFNMNDLVVSLLSSFYYNHLQVDGDQIEGR